ncbi:hypothetical protein DMUE_6103, partial [Dictyocoela muelleri]
MTEKPEFIISRKQKNKMIYRTYLFMQRETDNYIYWRCIRRNCSGRIHTSLNRDTILQESEHWHEKENERLTKIRVNDKLKKSAIETNEGFDNALLAVTLELNENDEKYLNKIDNMRDYFVRI